MHDMNMNEAYRCLDGVHGPRSCLSRLISTPTWHQIGLAVISRIPSARVECSVARQQGEDSSINDPFSSNNSRGVF